MPGRHIDAVWQHNPAIDAPPRYRRACRYQPFIPDQLTGLNAGLDNDAVGAVAEAEAAIAALNARAWPALAPLSRLLLRTESIASSRVEGLDLSVAELARAEARADTGDRIGPTAREILANIDAMELAIERAAAEPLGVEAICAIHARLMDRSSTPRIAGQLRAEQNWIGGNPHNPCGADFVPPPPEEVGALIGDLCAAAADQALSPVMQAALVHAQFETIHPFADGNGRTGRALIHVVLRARGLAPAYVPPISVVLARRRDWYVRGLESFRGDDVGPWVAQFADAAAEAANLAAAYLEAVTGIQERWREALQSNGAPRAGAAAWSIIDMLPAYPMLTGPAAVAGSGRARAAVYAALDQLEAAGVLKVVSRAKRNRVWEAAGLLDLLDGLEAGRMPEAG